MKNLRQSDNLREIIEKVDTTHTSVVINKHNILVTTRDNGDMRETPNITVKNIKRCRGGDLIKTSVGRLIMFAQLT